MFRILKLTMDNTQNTPNNKHLFALTAILFFAPAVPFVLKNNNYGLTKEENDFVKGYIKYGFIIIGIFIVGILSYLISYLYGNIISSWINFDISAIIGTILTWTGIIMIIVGIFMIFGDKPIFQKGIDIKVGKVKSGNFGLITNYIPLYNLYLWYSNNRDLKNYWWLKESIFILFLWIILGIISFNNPVLITFIFLIFILLRIGTLLGGIDFIKDNQKEKIDGLFNNNPEEIIGYVTGFLKFLISKFTKKKVNLNELISKDKKMYSQIVDLDNNRTQVDYKIFYIEYGLLIIFTLSYLIYINAEIKVKISGLFYTIPYLLLLARYGIVIYCKKLIPIPILHEISIKIKNLISIIK
ncbi:MAG: hypothetical protein V3575_07135 [Candidatus Absconditabacteria bacterium]